MNDILNANIRAFNLYAESLKINNFYSVACFKGYLELARRHKHSQVQEVWQKEETVSSGMESAKRMLEPKDTIGVSAEPGGPAP